MLEKEPDKRIKLSDIKVRKILWHYLKYFVNIDEILKIQTHVWVTQDGLCPLPSQEENCVVVEVTQEEIDQCVRSIPKLDTLVS